MRIRIPGIVDVVVATDRDAIRSAADSPLLDRQFVSAGPPINRLLLSRVRRALTVDGKRLPSITSRDDRERSAGQAALQERLNELSEDKIADNETLQAIVDAIRRKSDGTSIAIAAQQAAGRWFVADYVADAQSWQAACDLHAAVSSKNIPYVLYLFVSGKLRQAQRTLGERAKDDRTAIHATGIAVHNLVRGFTTMQQIWRGENTRHRLSDDAVLGRCLFAPENVLRQAAAKGASGAGDVEPGTLVILSLETARARDPGDDISFLSQSWSHCPAGMAVVRLFRAVWLKLKADGGHG
jgi:hypothetical protein